MARYFNPGKKLKIRDKLLKDYRLSIYDNSNLTEVFTSSVTRLSVWVILLFISLISVSITLILLFYTPLKRSIPGYPSKQMSDMILKNSIMLDSLEGEITKRDRFLLNIQSIIMGEIVEDTIKNTEMSTTDISLSPMNNDSIFEELIGAENYKFSYAKSDYEIDNLARMNFFPPVRGIVVNRFNASPGHFGADIVSSRNSQIAATLPGTVIFAEWSISTGYVVQLQHEYNLVSIYKHNADILVKPGERVEAGEIISIMGNEGELSTGPHLHFELWYNGSPIDPEKYINF
jgi:hypothetical protein